MEDKGRRDFNIVATLTSLTIVLMRGIDGEGAYLKIALFGGLVVLINIIVLIKRWRYWQKSYRIGEIVFIIVYIIGISLVSLLEYVDPK